MAIDWQRPADPASVAETASVLLPSTVGAAAGGLESSTEGLAGGRSEADRLARLADALATAQTSAAEGDSADLKANVLAGARSGLAKLNQGEPTAAFTLGDHVGLESVILTNGERPSLFVREGFVDLKAPEIGNWDFNLTRFEPAIRKVIASVGRIDIPVQPWYAGTCFVIAPGFVLTNRHVLEAIAVQDAAGIWTLNWPDATTVNFLDESEELGTMFKVVGVAFAGPDAIRNAIDFAHLDVAVLRVDLDSDKTSTFPVPVALETDVTQPKARRDLYVVGFPGQPKLWMFDGTPATGTETMQVISTVFNNRFGVKRLAPGNIKAGPGEVTNDAKNWICAHDASTLGGNSGSCVVDLGSDGHRIVGLHFAGANREQNWAHIAARLRDYLSEFSATFIT